MRQSCKLICKVHYVYKYYHKEHYVINVKVEPGSTFKSLRKSLIRSSLTLFTHVKRAWNFTQQWNIYANYPRGLTTVTVVIIYVWLSNLSFMRFRKKRFVSGFFKDGVSLVNHCVWNVPTRNAAKHAFARQIARASAKSCNFARPFELCNCAMDLFTV